MESTELRCPHCRETQYDTWEIGDGRDGNHNARCEECGKRFGITRRTEVWFTTVKRPRKETP